MPFYWRFQILVSDLSFHLSLFPESASNWAPMTRGSSTARPGTTRPVGPKPTLRRGRPPGSDKRPRLVPFLNPSGNTVWRVVGIVDGVRVRRNFETKEAAEAWRHERERERLGVASVETLRSTWLTEEQLRLAEGLFHRCSGDEIAEALSWWERHGKAHSAATEVGAGVSVQEAFVQFKAWLESSELRQRTRRNLSDRVGRLVDSLGHCQFGDLTTDSIEGWINSRSVSAATKDNDRRAVSRFFSWCLDRPRRWLANNPCSAIRIEQRRRGTPPTLTPDQCVALMRASEAHRQGRQVRYLALCLFGGVRPDEAAQVSRADVNLDDGEIRIRAEVSKTHAARLVPTEDTPLGAWFRAYPKAALLMSATTRRRDILAIRRAAGINNWPSDVMRHTAASALIRICGSYAAVADRLGNSETILRKHYVAGWSSTLAERWAATRPIGDGISEKPSELRASRRLKNRPGPGVIHFV